MALVEGEAFEDEISGTVGRQVVEIDVARESTKTLSFCVSEAGEHDLIVLASFQEAEDGVPFQAAPFFAFVVWAEDRDNQVGLSLI